jgi:glyoxylase-like metal-dependent hydrolase (beta-lactamase superfamily II)
MYQVYGIFQGSRELDYTELLPNVFACSTKGLIYYFLWCIKSEDSSILVDTGLNDKDARMLLTDKYFGGESYIKEKLKELGVYADTIDTVIVSHLHIDHFSAYHLYPNATFYIQRKDIEFFSGPASHFRQVYIPAPDMPAVMGLAYNNRIRYLDGDEQIAPGIRAVLIGGHTPGNQVIVVSTQKGDIVLCSDAMFLYANMKEESAGIPANLLDALLGFERLKKLTSSPDNLIPGHDPLIVDRFPSSIENVIEIA